MTSALNRNSSKAAFFSQPKKQVAHKAVLVSCTPTLAQAIFGGADLARETNGSHLGSVIRVPYCETNARKQQKKNHRRKLHMHA